MPKILITGNGFDLNIGLPTSYNDFIKILNFVSKSNSWDFHSVFKNSDNYEKIKTTFEPFLLEKEKIDVLNENLQHNLWFDFFKNEYIIDSWIDFENRIEYVLNLIFKSFENIRTNVLRSGSLHKDMLTWGTEVFNNNFEIIQVLSKFGIIRVEDSNSVTINEEYLISRYEYYSDLDLEKITGFLYKELIQFKKIFNYYFETFVFPFYDNIKIKLDRESYMMISHHYTFNYTPTFDKIYKPNNTTRFLHGKIDSSLNKIVIGINEIPTEKVDKKFFLPFTKYFQKLNNETDYIFLKEMNRNNNLNYMFFFYGHSLDRSDEDYINEVFDFVNNLKSKIKKIIVIYHNSNSKSKLLLNLLNIRGKNDVQELMREKILVFRQADSKELKKDLIRSISRTTIGASVM